MKEGINMPPTGEAVEKTPPPAPEQEEDRKYIADAVDDLLRKKISESRFVSAMMDCPRALTEADFEFMRDKGVSIYALRFLDKFTPAAASAICVSMVETGQGGDRAVMALMNEMPRLSGLSIKVAQRLIARKHFDLVMHNIKSFAPTGELVELLIERRAPYFMPVIINELNRHFAGLDKRALCAALVRSNDGARLLAHYLDLLAEYCDEAIAVQLFQQGYLCALADKMNLFKKPFGQEMAYLLIQSGYADVFFRHRDKFPGVECDMAMAKDLIVRNPDLANDFDRFSGLDYQVLADELLAAGEAESLFCTINKFPGVDVTAVCEKLIAAGQPAANTIGQCWDYICHLVEQERIVNKLFDAGLGAVVGEIFSRDSGELVMTEEVVNKIIAQNGAASPIHFWNRLPINMRGWQTMELILTAGGESAVSECLFQAAPLNLEPAICQAIVLKALENNWFEALRRNLAALPRRGIFDEEIMRKFLDRGLDTVAIVNIKLFKRIGPDTGARLFEAAEKKRLDTFTLYDNLPMFHGLDPKFICAGIMLGCGERVKANLSSFNMTNVGAVIDNLRRAKLMRQIVDIVPVATLERDEQKRIFFDIVGSDGKYAYDALANINRFDKLERKEVVDEFLARGLELILLSYAYAWPEVDHDRVLRRIAPDARHSVAVGEVLHRLRNLGSDLAFVLLPRIPGAVISNMRSFVNLDRQKLAEELARAGRSEFATYLDEFGLSPAHKHIGEVFIKKMLELILPDMAKAGDEQKFLGADAEAAVCYLARAIKVNMYFGEPETILRKAREVFGEYLDVAGLKLAHEILTNGEMSAAARQERAAIGMKKTSGFPALEELKMKINDFRQAVQRDDFSARNILQSSCLAAVFRKIVHYDATQFGGENSDLAFRHQLENYEACREWRDEDGKAMIKTLSPEYEPSGVVRVRKVDAAEQTAAEAKYPEAFLTRYQEILHAVQEARRMVRERKSVKSLLGRIKIKREAELARLRDKIKAADNEKARQNMQRRIENLAGLNLDRVGPENVIAVFTELARWPKEFGHELRAAAFWWSYLMNPEQMEREVVEMSENRPSLDDISWLINFTDEITNKATLRKYFESSEAAKNFKGLVNVKALAEELARIQNQAIKGTQPVRFVPTRGILMEFSGHLTDACWANKYRSIAQDFPHFTYVNMVLNPGKIEERFCGGAMLIEADTADQEKLLIIRGLNPLETDINSWSVKDFCDKFFTYANGIAQRLGRKLAIVIDEERGYAGTNRQVVYDYLLAWRDGLKCPGAVRPEDVRFNGYEPAQYVYLLDDYLTSAKSPSGGSGS